jgi:hypothetical protein
MSDTQASQPAGPGRPAQHTAESARPTGWVGWVVFAGVAMIVLGAFQIIEGLVAVFQRSFYVVTGNQLWNVNYDAWGWTHFGLGVAIVLVGLGVMRGALWARILGIVFAVASAIINLAFIGAYPVWSIIIIALDVLVIYALAVHGREMKYV